MIAYVIRRVIQAVIVTVIVTVIQLALIHLFPGGPVRALLGPRATLAEVAYFNHLYGFDQPFVVQYGKWAWQLLHGNLGYSVKLNQSVASLLATYLPKSIVLVALGVAVSLAFGIPLGVYQAVKRYTIGDVVLTGVSFLGYAAPTFFVALLLVEWFAIDTHLFPPFAPQASSLGGVLADPVALVLPVTAYAFGLFAAWSRFMRSSVMENLVEDYVRTGHGTGVLPGGAGRRCAHPAGFTLLATVMTIAGNLLADIGYAMLDPRVRYS